MKARLAVTFDRLGPYHVARLDAAGQLGELVAVEWSAYSRDYAWDQVQGGDSYQRVTVFPDRETEAVTPGELASRVSQTLERVRPNVVAIAGWSDRGSLAALRWCRQAGVPAVVMSDSQAIDVPRHWWTEAVKRRVVRGFAAGLVAGSRHVAYLASLGMPAERICTGYDVVDNAYFGESTDRVRQAPEKHRDRLGLPERFFLASNRFLPKKNLPTLLRAYAGYRAVTTGRWKLVLLGDGPMKDQLLELRERLDLEDDVLLPGFKQYEELPAYYALAGAFVHASTSDQWGLVVNEAMAAGLPVFVSERCGCAADLVVPGRNGFRFDPHDEAGLTNHLRKAAGGEYDLAAMGRASRELIRSWTPQTFAANLWKAAALALRAPRRKDRLADRLLLSALIRRPKSVRKG